ncbi:MAG: HPF/RaiA family ribosome-associated protein [bacterium]
MQVEVLSRHFSLGDAQKEYITGELEKLERFSPRAPVSAKMTLTRQKDQFTADLAFFLKSGDFRATETGNGPKRATDAVIENLKTQLRRYKGKITGRPKGQEGGLGRALVDREEQMDTDLGVVRPETFALVDMSVDDAMEAFGSAEHPFLVFRNSATEEVNVVYRREDGDLGLLEPSKD